MGTSKSVAQFTGKIAKAGAGIETANKDALTRAAKTSVDVLNATISSMVGADRLMHNAPRARKPTKLSAKAGHLEGKTERLLVKVGPKGPVALIDQGAPLHAIGLGGGTAEGVTFSGKRRKRTFSALGRLYNPQFDDARPLRMPGSKRGWVTGPVIHPGTGGKRRWTQTRDKVLPGVVRPILFAPHVMAVARAFS